MKISVKKIVYLECGAIYARVKIALQFLKCRATKLFCRATFITLNFINCNLL